MSALLGWKFRRIEDVIGSIEVIAPNGFSTVVTAMDRNPANLLYMIAKEALASPTTQAPSAASPEPASEHQQRMLEAPTTHIRSSWKDAIKPVLHGLLTEENSRAMFVARLSSGDQDTMMSCRDVLGLLNDCDFCASREAASPEVESLPPLTAKAPLNAAQALNLVLAALDADDLPSDWLMEQARTAIAATGRPATEQKVERPAWWPFESMEALKEELSCLYNRLAGSEANAVRCAWHALSSPSLTQAREGEGASLTSGTPPRA